MRVCSRELSLRQTFPHVRCGSACFQRQRQPLRAVHAARLQITSTSVLRRCMHIAPLGRPLSPPSLALGMSCHLLPGPAAFQPVKTHYLQFCPLISYNLGAVPEPLHRLFNGPFHGTYNAILVCFKRPYICTVDAKRATSHDVILFAVGTVT